MRTVHFPIEGESKEILDYLLNTYLFQNGSIILDKADVTFEVSTLMEPCEDRWYSGTVSYIINVRRCPKEVKNRNARYTGWIADSISEVVGIISTFKAGEKPHYKTKAVKKSFTPVAVEVE